MHGKLSAGTLHFSGAFAILMVFYLGGANLFGPEPGLGADGWIAQILGLFMVMPLLLIFARLVKLLPGMDLFEMLAFAWGRWLSTIVVVFYFFYFLGLAAMVRVYYGAFVQFVSLPNTPLVVILLAFFVLCTYLAKSGAETLGKWSLLLVSVLLVTAVALTILAVSNMRFENLLPLGDSGRSALMRGGARVALSPLGGAVVLLTLLGRFDARACPYRLFLFGAAAAVGMIALNFLRDASILGSGGMAVIQYPFFKAASVVQLGEIGARIEFPMVLPVLLAGITKAAVCLIAASKAVRFLFRLSDENTIIIPVAFFSVGISAVLAPNLPALLALPMLHLRAAPLFQVVLPMLLWLVAEIKMSRKPILKDQVE